MVENRMWFFLGDSRVGEGLKPVTVEQVLADRGMQLSIVNIWVAAAGPGEYRKIVRNLLGRHKTTTDHL